MKMKYLRKCIHEDGSEFKSIQEVSILSEAQGKHLIVTWNRQGKLFGYPKWKYKLWKFICN